MARMSRTNCLGAMLLVAFAISGCQSSNKWTTAWKERSKPKQTFQGVNGPEEVTYWPYKSDKSQQKITPMPSQLKDKIAVKTRQSKHDKELADLIKEGDQFRKNGQYENSRFLYTKALLISPDDPEVNHRLAIVADMEHQYAVADDHYRAALRVNPRDVNILSDFGYSYILRGNSQQAEITLKEALLIEPNHKGAMANLGTIYAQQNRYPEAVAMFRAGATESEAQQYLAKLFPYGRSIGGPGSIANEGHLPPGNVVASNRDSEPDLKGLTFEQIQKEMDRRAQESKYLRAQADQRELEKYKTLAASEAVPPQQNMPQQSMGQQPVPAANNPNYPRTNPQNGLAQTGPRVNEALATANLQPGVDAVQRPPGNQLPTASVSPVQAMAASHDPQAFTQRAPQDRSVAAVPGQYAGTDVYRGSASQGGAGQVPPNRGADPQIQRAWNGQMSGTSGNEIQQAGNLSSSEQMAMQLGMSAGPGGMFPIVQSNGSNSAPVSEASNSFDNRFGAEFQQTPQFQNNSSASINSHDPSRGQQSNPAPLTDNGVTAGPPSPASSWGNFGMDSADPHANPHNAAWWSGETRSSGGSPGTAADSLARDTGMGRNQARQSDGFDLIQSEIGSAVRGRPAADSVRPAMNENSRPYNGTWPNSNSLPQRQTQNALSSGTAPNGWNMQSANPTINTNGDFAEIQEPGTNSQPASSLPQYPYARNR